MIEMDFDGLEELFDEGAYQKHEPFDLRRIIASLLI
jgi:hypothetical protein